MTDLKPQVGDLVRATNKKHPEVTVTARAVYVSPYDGGVDVKGHDSLPSKYWTLEVLDRPLPPISQELLDAARNEWRKAEYGREPETFSASDISYAKGVTAVINFVREYDRTNNKENA